MRPSRADSKARAKKLPRSADAKGHTAALNLSDAKSAQAGNHCHVRSAMCPISQGKVGYSAVLHQADKCCAAISIPEQDISLTLCILPLAIGDSQYLSH